MKSVKGGKNFKKSTSGVSSIQINQGDASRLVGGIVEKGFSDEPENNHAGSLSVPRPSVIPFPLARHRSHGPVSFFLFCSSFFTMTIFDFAPILSWGNYSQGSTTEKLTLCLLFSPSFFFTLVEFLFFSSIH